MVETESTFPARYNPDGVESDDDDGGCCHWSTKQLARSSIIQAQTGSPEFGKPSSELDSDANPHNLVELVIDDSFLDLCIEATNEHAAEDASFIKEIGIIEKSEKGRAFMKGFLAVKWHLSLLGYSQKQWAWSEGPFKNQTEIKKVMTYLQFQLMAKDIRVTKPSELPRKGSPRIFLLNSIKPGVTVQKY